MPRSLLKFLAVLVLLLGVSAALADYTPDADVHIDITTPHHEGRAKHHRSFDRVNRTLTRAQEDVHRIVSAKTGYSVDYHYIWITLDGESLRVDPFEFNR